MNNFKNNFSELRLLANQNITISSVDGSFEFDILPMTLRDSIFNEDLGILLGLLEKEVSSLKEMLGGVEVKSYYDFIRTVCVLEARGKNTHGLGKALIRGIRVLIPSWEEVPERQTFLIKGVEVKNNLFDEIIEVIYKILGKEKIIIKDTDDEFTKREKEIKLRAQKIRNNKKNKNSKDKDDSFENVIAAIIYEFPQYKIEDVFNLNIFTFNYLVKYIGKIANYEVSKIAAGNGLTKKHKYFIEK